MIVIDIGNTNIVIGTYSKKKLNFVIRLKTKEKKLTNKLNHYFNFKKISRLNLDNQICVISSVSLIPLNEITIFFKKNKFHVLKINLNNIPKKINFHYVKSQLGADRIANTFSAINRYGANVLVIDFGTATTFDIIIDNSYEGGLIAPGINISHDALVNNASKLSKILITKTNKIIGNNTKDSMLSGFYWGYVSLINGLIKKIIEDKKIKPKIILTGGLAMIFKEEIKFKTFHEPNLTLEGLYLIGKSKYA